MSAKRKVGVAAQQLVGKSVQSIGSELVHALTNLKEEGRLVAELFIDLPDKKSYPDYFKLIKEPICLSGINLKIENHAYDSLDTLRRDVELMVSNALAFNAEGSVVYHDALSLQRHFYSQWKEKLADIQSLLSAVQVGDIKTTETLLKGGIDANRLGDANVPGLNQFMWGPVHCAAFYAQRGCLDLLVEFGADVECPDTLYKGRALGWAAYAGHLEMCRTLVKKYSADIKAVNVENRIAYDLVAEKYDAWEFLNPNPTKPAGISQNTDRSKPPSRENETLTTPTGPLKLKLSLAQPKIGAIQDTIMAPKVSNSRPETSESNEDMMEVDTENVPYQAPTNIPQTGRLVNSLGVISNGAILRCALPTDVHSHCITVDSTAVRNINFRVLLATRAVGRSQVQVFLNNKRLALILENKGDPQPVNAMKAEQDFTSVLQVGMNAFEVHVAGSRFENEAVINEVENYCVFINRI